MLVARTTTTTTEKTGMRGIEGRRRGARSEVRVDIQHRRTDLEDQRTVVSLSEQS